MQDAVRPRRYGGRRNSDREEASCLVEPRRGRPRSGFWRQSADQRSPSSTDRGPREVLIRVPARRVEAARARRMRPIDRSLETRSNRDDIGSGEQLIERSRRRRADFGAALGVNCRASEPQHPFSKARPARATREPELYPSPMTPRRLDLASQPTVFLSMAAAAESPPLSNADVARDREDPAPGCGFPADGARQEPCVPHTTTP